MVSVPRHFIRRSEKLSVQKRSFLPGFYAAMRPPGVTLSHHQKPFGSARSRVASVPPIWSELLHALWRARARAPGGRAKKKRLRSGGSANYTRLATPACSEPPERARMDTGPPQRQLCGPRGHVPHRHRILTYLLTYCLQEEVDSGRFDDRLQNAILAFRPPWYPTEPPHALRRATQARWMASAPTSSG